MSMTLATTWVRRGVAAQRPTKYEVDEAELDRISKLAHLHLQEAQQDLDDAKEAAQNGDEDLDETEDKDGEAEEADSALHKTSVENGNDHHIDGGDGDDDDDELKEYNLDDYDNEGEEKDEDGEPLTMFGNVRALAYHAPGEQDPYLVLPAGENDPDEDEEEREELQILPTDNLILAAKVEDEVAHLEVMVYEDDADNLYVHHDIMLPAVPLCVEWIDVPVGSRENNNDNNSEQRNQGNFVAVGTMSPEIEVWDLDVVDSMYPNAILGQQPEEGQQDEGEGVGEGEGQKRSKSKTKTKKKKKPKANGEYHVDAVLALAANRQHRNLLASASADKTVKLWDLNTCKCAKSYNMHTDKVCALDWHPTESTILLSGSYDKTVVATDMRAPDAVAPRWIVDADIERVRWDTHDPNFFYVTTESGLVYCFDARKAPESLTTTSKPVWMLQAHDGPVSAFDINPVVPGFLVTGSEDRKIKLWTVQDNKPSMVVARNLDVGRIFAAYFAPDPEVAFRLSVAGSRGQVQVWDTSTNAAVRSAFAHRVKMPEGDAVKERLVGATGQGADSDESEDDDDDDNDNNNNDEDAGWESMDQD